MGNCVTPDHNRENAQGEKISKLDNEQNELKLLETAAYETTEEITYDFTKAKVIKVYDGDTVTDRSERFLAAEILREKVFRFTGEELPYTSTVVIDQFKMDGKMRRISATILVDRDSHKAMIIGQKGERLKKISTDARIDMEKLFDGKVFLETWVKVKRGWADDRAELRAQGLE